MYRITCFVRCIAKTLHPGSILHNIIDQICGRENKHRKRNRIYNAKRDNESFEHVVSVIRVRKIHAEWLSKDLKDDLTHES